MAWFQVIAYDDIPATEMYNQAIWNNDIIRFKGDVFLSKEWISGGVVYVGDLFIDDLYMTLDQLVRVLRKLRELFMFQYFALYNSLPVAWRQPQEQLYLCTVVEMYLPSRIHLRKAIGPKSKHFMLC